MSNTSSSGVFRQRISTYRPAIDMFLSVVLQAIVILIIVQQLDEHSPFFFGSGLALGLVIGNSLYLVTAHRRIVTNPSVRRAVFSRARLLHPHFWIAAVSRCDFAIFGLSIAFLSPAAATIIFGLWPVFFIVFLERLARPNNPTAESGRRYHRITPETLIYVFIAFLGLAFIVAARDTSGDSLVAGSANLWLGSIVAIAGALLWALSAFGYRWGIDTSVVISSSTADETPPRNAVEPLIVLELVTTLIGVVLSTIPAVLLLLTIGVLDTPGPVPWSIFGLAVLVGTLIDSPALVLLRRANLGTRELGVNALGYLAPVMTLGFLAAFSQLGDVHGDFIAIGTAAIVSMNLFLNFDPEKRLGFNQRLSFKSLVISMWLFGSLIYLRDRWFGSDLVEWSATDYWSILAVVTTVFTLLLSFRVTRLHSRTTFEEYHLSLAFRKLEDLVRRGVISRRSLDDMIGLDSTTDPYVIRENYGAIRRAISHARRNILPGEPVSSDLASIEGEIDALVQSKQFGREFAEVVSVVLLGVLTIGLTVSTRPPVVRWSGLTVDMVGIILASVVTFLMFNLIDLRRERDSAFVEKNSEHPHDYQAVLRQVSSPIIEQVVSLAIAVLLMATLGGLLYDKWLG